MRSLPQTIPAGAWPQAVRLLERWLDRHERVDALLADTAGGGARAPAAPEEAGRDRARCQHLLFGVVRHLGRLDGAIGARVARPPRARLRAVLLVAGFELLEAGWAPEGGVQAAKIVHHAVAQAKALLSAAEARLVNAVLRKLAAADELHAPPPPSGADVAALARYFSHPEWLVRRWRDHFGPGPTLSLLTWNQTPPPVYARWRSPRDPPPAWLQPTAWPGFHVVPVGRWPEIEPLLAAGACYLQDPATCAAASLLDPQPGEDVLDLCAAPGGKSLLLADLLEQRAAAGTTADAVAAVGRVVAVDLPDARRIRRLRENLARVRRAGTAVVQADLRKLTAALFGAHRLPAAYPAVLLDVPCSNTGVIRHRIDVKWRLRETDVARHAAQQRALLAAAARLVAPGGRLVYSTCSLEPEENEEVVTAFLHAANGRFAPDQSRVSRPWESGCDGGGAFLLRRRE